MSDMHVRLRIGSEQYAVPVGNVLEVAHLGGLTAVPGTGPAVLGVRNLQGQVLPVFDLARVLGVPRGGPAPCLVVAEQGGRLAGLAVDEVTGVTPLTGDVQAADADYLSQAILGEGSLIGVVDVVRVFEALGRFAA